MAMFTDIDEADRATIESTYMLAPTTSLIPISDGVSETTFRLRTTNANYIVTIFETVVTEAHLDRAFEVMEQLNEAGVPCPRPLRSLHGTSSIILNGKRVALVSFVEGHKAFTSTEGRCRELGKLTAKIHIALGAVCDKPANNVLLRGLVHGALTRDNLFFIGDELTGVINFRLIHESILVEELAALVADWATENGTARAQWVLAMVEGYESVRPLNDAERLSLAGMIEKATKERASAQ